MDRKKAAILALSLLTIISTDTVAPLVKQISASYPQVSDTLVKMTITLPSLMMIFFGLIAGQLVKVISKKAILIIGLVLYSIGGIAAGWSGSFTAHLFLRALVGAGVGLISPIITSLVADYYKGKERADMVGYTFAISHFGAVITPPLAAYLGVENWRNAFIIFSIVPLVLLFTMIFLPGTNRRLQDEPKQEKAPIPTRAIQCAVIGMLMMIVFFIIVTDLPYLVDTKEVVSPILSAFGLSTFTMGATIAGLTFSQIYLKLKKWVIPISLLMCGLGYMVVTFSGSSTLILAGLLSIGMGIGILLSLITLITTNSVGEADSTAAVALTSAGFSIGIFISPFFYANLPHFGMELETAEFNFLLAGTLFLIVGLISLLLVIFHTEKRRKEAIQTSI